MTRPSQVRFLHLMVSLTLFALTSALAACGPFYEPTAKPDNTIKVVATPNGYKAVPPGCLSWANYRTDPYDNQPNPQFGCSTARNLAMSVDQPKDLIQGREMGPSRSVLDVGAIRRYDNNQTRGLIDPNTSADSSVAATTASSPSSTMTGDVTGAASSGGGSSGGSSSTPSIPAGP